MLPYRRPPVALLVLISLAGHAQELPPEWYFTNEGHQLHVGGQPSAGFYQKELIRTNDLTSTNGISDVTLYYCHGLNGPFQRVAMFDDGAHNDGAAGDGVYGASIPPAPGMTQVRYYIEASAGNAAQSLAFDPPGAEHDVYTYQVQFDMATNAPVVVNELMAQNNSTAVDQDGSYEDWIELFNTTGEAVDLGGGWLSDNSSDPHKWQFPSGLNVPANGYLIIWADDDLNDGSDHASFKLSADGEEVLLTGPDGFVWDHVVFGPQMADMGYARIPNGSGPFEIQEATFNANNEGATSITAVPIPAGMVFFPNPVSDVLTLRLHGDAQNVTICDATGRGVWSGHVIGMVQLNTSAWVGGTYFVRHATGVDKLMVLH